MKNLDMLVAERVMGWEWWNACGKSHICPPFVKDYPTFRHELHFRRGKDGDPEPIENYYSNYGNLSIPRYSSNIAAAWEVVEKMRTNGWFFSLADSIELPDFIARFTTCPPVGSPIPDHSAMNVSAPLAICLAALRAVGVSEQEIEAAMGEGAA